MNGIHPGSCCSVRNGSRKSLLIFLLLNLKCKTAFKLSKYLDFNKNYILPNNSNRPEGIEAPIRPGISRFFFLFKHTSSQSLRKNFISPERESVSHLSDTDGNIETERSHQKSPFKSHMQSWFLRSEEGPYPLVDLAYNTGSPHCKGPFPE